MRRTLLMRKRQPIGACTLDDVELDVEIVAQEGQSAMVYGYDSRRNRKENMTRIIYRRELDELRTFTSTYRVPRRNTHQDNEVQIIPCAKIRPFHIQK